MLRPLLLLLLLAALLAVVAGEDCSAATNDFAIASKTPSLVRGVPNGHLYLATDDVTGNALRVIHLYGSAYEMGVAQAALMGPEIVAMLTEMEGYIERIIGGLLPWLPKDIQRIIERDGALAGLQLTVDLTRPFTPQHFFDEMHGVVEGLADPSITYNRFYQMQMFPEMIKAACSMFGAWGPAVPSTSTLLQLRALDFGLDSPLYNHSALFVYHPTDGFPFASLSWVGFVGSVTAFSGAVGISEKVWLHYNESSTRAGIPFHFLMRDVAQFDRTIDSALNRMINNRRTCSVFLGVGSNHTNQFRVCEYAHDLLNVYDDANFPAYLPAHPLKDGLVFLDKHTQPSQDTCLGSLLQKYYGKITAEVTIKNILAPFGTGDLHAAIYDFSTGFMYASVAGTPYTADGQAIEDGTVAPAYQRPWFRFDMNALFALPASK